MSERILLVRMSALGDVIHATPVARGLKRVLPDCHLTWFIRERAAAVLEGNPHIDATIVLPEGARARDYLRVWWQLKAGRFTTAIDLETIIKGATVTYISGADRRIGSRDAHLGTDFAYTEFPPGLDEHEYVSQRYLQQCESFGVDVSDYVPELFLSDDELREADEVYAEHGLDGSGPVIAAVRFANDMRREWPEESFAELGDMLARRIGARFFIPGTQSERPRAESMATRMQCNPTVLAGTTSYRQVAALLARADLVVGVDSGLTHTAYALSTPTVSLIGRTSLAYAPKGERFRAVWARDVECRPCPHYHRCTDPICMTAITPSMVADAVMDLAATIGLA